MNMSGLVFSNAECIFFGHMIAVEVQESIKTYSLCDFLPILLMIERGSLMIDYS